MNENIPLSAVIIAFNEEQNISRCLQSLAFCSEIIVVDSGSLDKTEEICASYSVRFFVRSWEGYAAQKNFANGLAKNDWVLSLDADEEVSEDLKNEIIQLLATNPNEAAFSMPRKTIHLGRWIRYGGWYPNRLVRLFRSSQGRWIGEDVHERWESSGKIGKLVSDLVHYSFANLEDQVERNNRYSTLGAIQLKRNGQRFSAFRLFAKTTSKFIETYFFKKGFLDGYPGLIISVSAAYSVFLKWAKLWELQTREKKE